MLRFFYARGIGYRVKLFFPVIFRGIRRRIFFGDNVVVDRFSSIICELTGEIRVGNNSYIGAHAFLKAYGGSICIGENCSINAFTFINGAGGVVIGDDVRIASHCSIISSNHIFSDLDQLIRKQGVTRQGICIEDNVWIGTGVRILDGVTIGHGSVVAAGAVVTKNVPPQTVVGGVPCKVIKVR